jgi:hypothetical protein
MSIVLPDDIGFILRDANSSGTNPASLKTRLGWLREWEQAQWKLGQQRSAAGNPPPYESRVLYEASSHGHGPVETHREQMNTGLQNNQETSQNMRAPDGPHVRQISQLATAAMMAPHGGPYPDFALYGPSLFVSRFLPVPVHSPGGLSPPAPTWNPEPLAEWRPYLLHVMQGAGGIRVWIRDKQLSESSEQEIAASIRNELSLRGMNLLSLTVNGKEILRSAAIDDNAAASFVPDMDTTINRTY